MHQVGSYPGAGSPEGVSQSRGAAVHIQLLHIELEGLGARQSLRYERFVDLQYGIIVQN